MKRVLIFRNELLPTSETFIRAQTMALRKFEPFFAGVHPALNSLDLPVEPIYVSSSPSVAGKLKRRLFWRTAFAPGFYRRLQKIKPDLVHAHFAVDGAAALPICSHLGKPLVVTLHGYDITTPDEALRKSEEGKLYLRRREVLWKEASLFLCVSEFVRQRALAKGFPEGKLRLHYTGLDLATFRQLAVERDRNLIVFVGRLIEKKGCRYLLDALALVSAKIPEAHLVVIGTGPMDSRLRQQALDMDLSCEFLGSQPVGVVKDYLSRARVFCVPSVRGHEADGEGLGMVFAESLAMGTPVASFWNGGIPEIVRDGSTGLLAPDGDTPALADNLIRLLRDDVLWKGFSDAGGRSIWDTFDIQQQTARLEDIYTQVILGHVGSCG